MWNSAHQHINCSEPNKVFSLSSIYKRFYKHYRNSLWETASNFISYFSFLSKRTVRRISVVIECLLPKLVLYIQWITTKFGLKYLHHSSAVTSCVSSFMFVVLRVVYLVAQFVIQTVRWQMIL
jgi:hypothetical protein